MKRQSRLLESFILISMIVFVNSWSRKFIWTNLPKKWARALVTLTRWSRNFQLSKKANFGNAKLLSCRKNKIWLRGAASFRKKEFTCNNEDARSRTSTRSLHRGKLKLPMSTSRRKRTSMLTWRTKTTQLALKTGQSGTARLISRSKLRRPNLTRNVCEPKLKERSKSQ